MDEGMTPRGLALIYLVAINSGVVVLVVAVALVTVIILAAHWALAVFVFGIGALSWVVGSWLSLRSIRRRKRG